jgi:hypothetical protein
MHAMMVMSNKDQPPWWAVAYRLQVEIVLVGMAKLISFVRATARTTCR